MGHTIFKSAHCCITEATQTGPRKLRVAFTDAYRSFQIVPPVFQGAIFIFASKQAIVHPNFPFGIGALRVGLGLEKYKSERKCENWFSEKRHRKN
jgi:hypothetical protein